MPDSRWRQIWAVCWSNCTQTFPWSTDSPWIPTLFWDFQPHPWSHSEPSELQMGTAEPLIITFVPRLLLQNTDFSTCGTPWRKSPSHLCLRKFNGKLSVLSFVLAGTKPVAPPALHWGISKWFIPIFKWKSLLLHHCLVNAAVLEASLTWLQNKVGYIK